MSYQVIVNRIASNKTEKGLEVNCERNTKHYDTCIKIAEKEMKAINLTKTDFHGELNN